MALEILLQWIWQHLPDSVRIEAHPADGIDRMIVPDGCERLLEEVRAGAQVGEALSMLLTADNPLQARGDEAVIRERLEAYWKTHGSAAPAPPAMASWSGL
jgi:hypothetical protein